MNNSVVLPFRQDSAHVFTKPQFSPYRFRRKGHLFEKPWFRTMVYVVASSFCLFYTCGIWLLMVQPHFVFGY
jgi:hypothetical protein